MLGKYVRISPNGTNLFFNKLADTIRIETMAHIGESWKVWSGETFSVYGEMLETELGEVFGTPDSIKSIRLNAFDEDMNLVENFMFNDSIIRLSKNYGLLTTFNFVVFPNMYEYYFGQPCKLYSLYGIESEGMGGDNLTTFDVFDFQPGDIIEFERKNLDYGNGTIWYYREEFITRQNYTDSIVYELNRTVLINQVTWPNQFEYSLSEYQTTRTIKRIEFLETLPTLPLLNSAENGYFSVMMNEEVFLQKQNLEHAGTGNTFFISDDGNCLFPPIDGTCYGQPASYYEGLGGPYHECNNGAPFVDYRKLMYFEKDTVVWGTPFDFTVSLENSQKKQFFNVYPNPATDKITLQLEGTASVLNLEILDLSGRSIRRENLNANQTELDISELQNGVYFIRISVSGNVGIQKLIVQ